MEIRENSRPSICLNMIVKDESHIIKKTLEMLCSKINFSYWVICDTGSTDKTPEIITNFFKEKNIPGELFVDEWQNFAHNRTLALQRAYNKTDLLLVFDADDEIVGDIQMPTTVLSDEYFLKFGPPGGMEYVRVLLINNRKRFEYLSVIHEYISCKEPNSKQSHIEGNYYVVSGRSGNRNQDPKKYLKDALILEKAYKEALEKNDEIFHRYAFYCANSYKDYGQYEEAIKWYKITLSHERQWNQEKYLSCLYSYICYAALNQPDHGFFYLVEGIRHDPERVECIHFLVQHYCINNMYNVAYNYYLLVKDFYENRFLNTNMSSKLFIESDKYELFLPFHMILVADKIKEKDASAHITISKMFEIIFKKKSLINHNFIGNVLYNLQFFIDNVIKHIDGFLNLFQEYICFLENSNVSLTQHNFLDKYEKYGIVFKHRTIKPQKFSEEDCKKSNKILIYTGFSNLPWNYTYSLTNALGGSETAVCNLVHVLSKHYKEYEIYVGGSVAEENIGNIHFVNLHSLHQVTKENAFHTVIISRYIGFYEMYPETSFYQSFIWGHDICIYPYGCNLDVSAILEKWYKKINGCICQTEWHMNLFKSQYPKISDKMYSINNGIQVEKFTYDNKKVENRFIYSSCSERGLDRLIELWPQIVNEIPGAELYICSYNNFPHNDYENQLEKIIKQYASIKHVGCLNRDKLYELMSTCEFWLYPTNFAETSCITAMEMLMSEVICVYYPIAGLINTMGTYGIQVERGNEIQTIKNLSVIQKHMIKQQGKKYAMSCSWENRMTVWADLCLLPKVYFNDETKTESTPEPPKTKNNIKVINLKKREDRKKAMIEQFKRENISTDSYEFIEAVDGHELQESEELSLLFEGNNFYNRKGVIGCALSHLGVWNTLINDNKNEYYVILEDDLELSTDFKEKLDIHCKLFVEQQIEHLSLGAFDCNHSDQEKIKTNELDIKIFQKDVYKFWNVAFAYIISKNAARKMVSYINRCSIKCAIDNPLSHGEVVKYHHTTNCIAKQRNIHEVGSDIQHNHDGFNFKNFDINNYSNKRTKSSLRIAYCDWWYHEYCGGSFDLNDNFIINVIRKYGYVENITVVQPHESPDLLLYSIFGNEHIKYTNVRRVFFSGEPFGIRAEAEFNFTFDRNSDKNTRFPLWLGYLNDYLLEECNRRKNGVINVPKREHFCSFIANGEVKTTHRRTIVEKLSQYKKVHCGGAYLNNLGYTVPRGVNCSGKIEHNNKYKFAIAFENEDYPGYVTEKICDIYKSNCVPIYWGTQEVVRDFNPSTFINARDFANFDELVEYIIKVDNDDELYASFFKEPFFSNKWMDAFNDPSKSFYKNLADCILGINSNLYYNYLTSIKNKNKNNNNNLENIIFLNTSSVYTGIYHYGIRLFNIVKKSSNFNYHYFEIQDENEYHNVLQNFSTPYKAIIYNHTGALWPWLNKNITKNKNVIHIGIPHEEFHRHSDYFFDIILNIDPTKPDTLNSYAIPRPIYENVPELLQNYNFSTKTIEDFINYSEPNVPIIGSFGFGFDTKGFDEIVTLVNQQYDNAIIKFVITFPYNNQEDTLPQLVKEKCERNNIKSGIKLLITHEFFSNEDLLYFLNTNTINIFLYNDSKMFRKRSISSVIDYALSVNKPIGISSSSMFANIYNDDICLEKISIQKCIDNYPTSLENIKQKYAHNNVIKCFDNILKSKVVKRFLFKNIDSIDIKYGIPDIKINVKEKLLQKISDNLIYITDVDDYRVHVFTEDPVPGVEKYIYIMIDGKEIIIDQNFYIYIDTKNNKIYINCKPDSEQNKMKIVFSNNCSVGDIYFSQPFIKNIVTNNPDYDYYFYHMTSSYYFTDLLQPNIKDVNKIPEFKEELYNVFGFRIDVDKLINIHNMSNYTYRYDSNNNILLICTWAGRMMNDYSALECNMINYNEVYKRMIDDINNDLELTLNYKDTISLDVYPSVPTLHIDKYREFQKLHCDKKIIFYYNFLPCSGQKFPIKSKEEHNIIIENLAEQAIVVITDKKSYFGNNKNVYFADDFIENVEYYDAKNFYYQAQMAYETTFSVYYDLGRSFMYMNKTFIEDNNKNIRLHISNNEYYYNTLNKNTLIPENYCNLIKVENYTDVIIQLTQIINFYKNNILSEKICFDIGANIGNWSLQNVNKYDKIIAVEASENTFNTLVNNVEKNQKIVPINYAVCDLMEEYIKFYNCDSHVLSTTNEKWLQGGVSRFNVNYKETLCKTISIDKLIEIYGIPDLIKIDVECAEYECIKSMTKKCNNLCFEWASEFLDNILNSLNYLYKLGYRFFYIQMNNDSYTFQPSEYYTIDRTKEILSKTIPRCDWGMIWCK